jgi:hypothetical protein
MVVRVMLELDHLVPAPLEAALDVVVGVHAVVAQGPAARRPNRVARRHRHSRGEDREIDGKPHVLLLEDVDDLALDRVEVQPEEEPVQPGRLLDHEADLTPELGVDGFAEVEDLEGVDVREDVRAGEVLDAQPQVERVADLREDLAGIHAGHHPEPGPLQERVRQADGGDPGDAARGDHRALRLEQPTRGVQEPAAPSQPRSGPISRRDVHRLESSTFRTSPQDGDPAGEAEALDAPGGGATGLLVELDRVDTARSRLRAEAGEDRLGPRAHVDHGPALHQAVDGPAVAPVPALVVRERVVDEVVVDEVLRHRRPQLDLPGGCVGRLTHLPQRAAAGAEAVVHALLADGARVRSVSAVRQAVSRRRRGGGLDERRHFRGRRRRARSRAAAGRGRGRRGTARRRSRTAPGAALISAGPVPGSPSVERASASWKRPAIAATPRLASGGGRTPTRPAGRGRHSPRGRLVRPTGRRLAQPGLANPASSASGRPGPASDRNTAVGPHDQRDFLGRARACARHARSPRPRTRAGDRDRRRYREHPSEQLVRRVAQQAGITPAWRCRRPRRQVGTSSHVGSRAGSGESGVRSRRATRRCPSRWATRHSRASTVRSVITRETLVSREPSGRSRWRASSHGISCARLGRKPSNGVRSQATGSRACTASARLETTCSRTRDPPSRASESAWARNRG